MSLFRKSSPKTKNENQRNSVRTSYLDKKKFVTEDDHIQKTKSDILNASSRQKDAKFSPLHFNTERFMLRNMDT